MVDQRAGRFIVFEGPDGSGKTTQAARLVAWLRSSHGEVIACRDPGSTALGDRLRTILLERSTVDLGLMAEMLLYMASRAQLVEEVIAPALDRDAIVVADRYLLSNIVYQGHAGGLGVDDVLTVGRIATGGLMPDLTLLIDVEPSLAASRIGPARDRIEARGGGYREQVRQGYLEFASMIPSPSVVIDGSLSPDEVESQVRREVSIALGIGPRS